MEKTAVHITHNGNEPLVVHMLEGKAPEHINLEAVDIFGDILSVSNYLNVRKKEVDKMKSHILFNEEQRSIYMMVDEASPRRTRIYGKLEDYPALGKFGINQKVFWTLTELEKLLRMNRYWFFDKEQHMRLIGNLRDFSAQVQSDIRNAQDNRGNKNQQHIKQVKSDLAADFALRIPLYKGTEDPSRFTVEICYDINDSIVRFWLESVDLYELQTTFTQEIFKKQREQFVNDGYVVINI